MRCEKYRLDKTDPDDIHFLHKNGTLFISDTQYDVDKYCVENTQIRQIEVSAF